VRLDGRRRVVLPTSILRGITWLSAGGEALGILDAVGQIRLIEWAKGSGPVIERRRAIAAAQEDDAQVSAALRALDDRYRRLWVDRDGRLQLPHAAVLHLALTGGDLVAYAFPDCVELWSPAHRANELERLQDVFAGLP
jgi:hypothetical protein